MGHVLGDNSVWQMASMQNLTLDEAIARITISTQVDAPGTKIVLRRCQGGSSQKAVPADEQQNTPQPGQGGTPPDGKGPGRAPMETVTLTAGRAEAMLTPRTNLPKDAWNRQQLSRCTGNDTVCPVPLPPPPRDRHAENRSSRCSEHSGGSDQLGGYAAPQLTSPRRTEASQRRREDTSCEPRTDSSPLPSSR